MKADRQYVIVAYDIACNSRRRAVLRVLSEWRVSGQKSVHVCWLTREKAESLFVELCAVVNPEQDKLLLAFSRDVVMQTSATEVLAGLVVH